MKKALLVGINYPSTQYALRGCINDVTSVSQMLINKFGFTEPNCIRMLVDGSATTENILERLHWLVKDAKPGDVLFFGYSGHGAQVINNNYNDIEPDGLDECICPIDMNWRDKVITDDMMKEIFSTVPNGVNLTVVLDCCHSGDGIRDFEPPLEMRDNILGPTRNKSLKMPADIANRALGRELLPKPRSLQNSNIVPIENQTGLLISGCRSNETSADAWIQKSKSFQGALTYNLLDVLAQHNYNITYRDLVQTINTAIEQQGYTQHPELDGKSELFDKPFLQPL